MALRDQPYIPLYVQDVLTDEKLIECSAEAHGIYFRLLCILHKQETYGLLCMKQKYKQSQSKFVNFALMLSKQMPFDSDVIHRSLSELFTEGVIDVTDDELSQRRMVYDGRLSLVRAETGKKGGSNVTKQYGKSGFLYLMSDTDSYHKIGISVNPKNRLYRLRSDLTLPKSFDIIDTIEVSDMGKTEDFAQSFFKETINGEWVTDSYENVKKQFALLKAKIKAKPKANTEYEDENVNDNESINNNKNEFDFSKPDIDGDDIVFPIDTKPARELWAKWKEYRFKEHGQRYGMMGEQADLKRFNQMTYSQMEQSILSAMANKWKNLYPEQNKGRNGTRANTKEQQFTGTVDYVKQHYSDKINKK